MNIYKELNEIIEYIEEHLEEKIDTEKLARKIGINEYTFQRIFAIIADISLTEYIRNRRLTNAGQELYLKQEKVIDVAIKYGYNNATAFSRAFERFHGIKPSEVRKKPEKLKMYTKLHFNENIEYNKSFEYKITEKEEMTSYGEYITTDNKKIKQDAPKLYMENAEKYGNPPFGIIEYYDKERTKVKSYGVFYYENKGKMKKITIPKSKWIQITINSQITEEIQKTSEMFYQEFLPNSKYNFRDIPEIEFYHDKVTDFLIPIEK